MQVVISVYKSLFFCTIFTHFMFYQEKLIFCLRDLFANLLKAQLIACIRSIAAQLKYLLVRHTKKGLSVLQFSFKRNIKSFQLSVLIYSLFKDLRRHIPQLILVKRGVQSVIVLIQLIYIIKAKSKLKKKAKSRVLLFIYMLILLSNIKVRRFQSSQSIKGFTSSKVYLVYKS